MNESSWQKRVNLICLSLFVCHDKWKQVQSLPHRHLKSAINTLTLYEPTNSSLWIHAYDWLLTWLIHNWQFDHVIITNRERLYFIFTTGWISLVTHIHKWPQDACIIYVCFHTCSPPAKWSWKTVTFATGRRQNAPLLHIIACCPWLPLLRGGLCKSTESSWKLQSLVNCCWLL